MRCPVGLGGISVEFPRARELWIPAFAGMTGYFPGRWGNGTMNSRDVEVVLCGMRCPVGLGGISVEFPRARELWIPAFAGMTGYFPGRWGNGTMNSRDVEVVLCGMRCPVGLGGISVEFPRARELWIPAFAGMTGYFPGRWGNGTMNSRDVEVVLCGMRYPVGLGGISAEFPHARELWIPAFAGMTEYFFGCWGNGTKNSRMRGNCRFPPSRE